jgi:hypothetical protein
MAGKIRQGRRRINFDRKQVRSVPLCCVETDTGKYRLKGVPNHFSGASRVAGFWRTCHAKMTKEDWALVLAEFDACRSRREDGAAPEARRSPEARGDPAARSWQRDTCGDWVILQRERLDDFTAPGNVAKDNHMSGTE